MIHRTKSPVQELGAALALTLVLFAPACVTFRGKKTQVAAAPAVLPPAEPLSSPQVTERLPPPQAVPAAAIPPDTAPLPEPPTLTITAPGELTQPARTVHRTRPAAAAVPPAEAPAPPPVKSDSAPVSAPQLRPLLTAAQERQLQTTINRSLAAAERLLKSAVIPPSDRERTDLVARVRAYIDQAQQARRQGDLNSARSLAERAELTASDLVRSPR